MLECELAQAELLGLGEVVLEQIDVGRQRAQQSRFVILEAVSHGGTSDARHADAQVFAKGAAHIARHLEDVLQNGGVQLQRFGLELEAGGVRAGEQLLGGSLVQLASLAQIVDGVADELVGDGRDGVDVSAGLAADIDGVAAGLIAQGNNIGDAEIRHHVPQAALEVAGGEADAQVRLIAGADQLEAVLLEDGKRVGGAIEAMQECAGLYQDQVARVLGFELGCDGRNRIRFAQAELDATVGAQGVLLQFVGGWVGGHAGWFDG